MRSSRPTSRSGAKPTTPGPIGHSSIAFSPRFSINQSSRVRGFGLPTRRPVFVVGLPRSGTTLGEQVLASHPAVFGAGELRLVWDILDLLPQAAGRDAPPLDCIAHVDQKAVGALARAMKARLEAMGSAALRVVDKMPENTLYLGWIATLFPLAILIHCRRDRATWHVRAG